SRLRRRRWPTRCEKCWTRQRRLGSRSLKNWPKIPGKEMLRLVGLRIVLGPGFANRRECFDIKAFVIRIAGYFVDLKALQEQDTRTEVGFFIGGKPDFVVDEGLLENKAGTFLQIGDEPPSQANVFDEVCFEAGDVVGFFVNPHDAR